MIFTNEEGLHVTDTNGSKVFIETMKELHFIYKKQVLGGTGDIFGFHILLIKCFFLALKQKYKFTNTEQCIEEN